MTDFIPFIHQKPKKDSTKILPLYIELIKEKDNENEENNEEQKVIIIDIL